MSNILVAFVYHLKTLTLEKCQKSLSELLVLVMNSASWQHGLQYFCLDALLHTKLHLLTFGLLSFMMCFLRSLPLNEITLIVNRACCYLQTCSCVHCSLPFLDHWWRCQKKMVPVRITILTFCHYYGLSINSSALKSFTFNFLKNNN